jgi:hypothetical protein
MDENEANHLKQQVRALQMTMLKMEERMKEMEKHICSNNRGAIGNFNDDGAAYTDNLEYLNAKMKLDHGDEIGSVQENIGKYVEIEKTDIIDIVNESIDFNSIVLHWIVEVNMKYKFMHAFPRDKNKFYMYNFHDLVWYDAKNKDICQLYSRVQCEIMNKFTEMIAEDQEFMDSIFDRMHNMYNHNIQKDVSSFRKRLVEKLLHQ